MKKKIIIKRIPADVSKDSIKDVFSIVIVGKRKDMGAIDNTIVHLEGTVEEKLQQYKDATGNDWPGFDEKIFSKFEYSESICLNLGQEIEEKYLSEADKEVQEKIDALLKQAKQWVKESREEEKTGRVTPKEVEAQTTL